ncbi:MAG: bifunctional riboflavin kinase/FMN adenylyltransferase [Dehalococcoidia bacterium]|jgi:riboflavin kinase/FMN adenylyltransferase|nr:bifunctional riboflavin kinase/FMN adenylyltransferase [Dehalococcoidia bacterium]
MSIIDPFSSIDPLARPTVATVGTFDGVHLGHRALLLRVVEEAAARGGKSVALVFKEQPRAFIKPGVTVSYLCDFATRRALLNEIGIDEIVELEFGPEIQQLSSAGFVTGLQARIGLQALVVGPGARIGSDRAGVEELVAAGTGDVDFIAAPAEAVAGQMVSSSAVRRAITAGDCELTAAMLGRNYAISGTVATGERRGQELGFPTANIEPDSNIVIPANGIYATLAGVEGTAAGAEFLAATSIGVRPTFEIDGRRTVEAFLLDFDGDLYTQRLRLEFVTRLRSEVAFESAEQLVEQMNKDVAQTRQVLAAR